MTSMRSAKRWVAALLLVLACAAPAAAQRKTAAPPAMSDSANSSDHLLADKGDPPGARLDAAKQALDKINSSLNSDSLKDEDLVRMRGDIDPVVALVRGVTDEVAPKQAAIKTRLDQLGAPPDPKANPPAAPEDPNVAQERKDQQKLQSTFDDLGKRANLLQVRADQLATQIGDRRRTLFTNSVFLGGSSIVAPKLWLDAARGIPGYLYAFKSAFAEFVRDFLDQLSASEAALFAALLASIGVAGAVATRAVVKILPRDKPRREANDLRLAITAIWSGLAVIAVPLATIAAVFYLIDWFDDSESQLRPFGHALLQIMIPPAIAAGLITAVLAPYRPNWRPLNLSDGAASRLSHLIFALMLIAAFGKVIEAMAEAGGASLQASVATRGLFSLLVGLLLARGLLGLNSTPERINERSTGKAASLDEAPLWAPIRFLAWAGVVAIVAADLLGYIALSAFLVNQIAWMAFVGSLLFLTLKLVENATAQGFRPNSRLSRNLNATLGVGRDSLQQIGVLLSGLITVVLSAFALMLVLVPWGVQSHDMLGAVQSLYFGVKIGDVTISLSNVVLALVYFTFGYVLTRAVRNWLDNRYLPLTQLDQGLRGAISASVGYLGIGVTLGLSVTYLGLSLDKLALVAGALSVGIGLGLQGIVANFVSGMILLWERAIRVGDLVVVSGEQGYVRRISIRSTEIETFDRATTIVPNGDMVSGVVKNFVRGDRVGRVAIPVRVVWASDPEQVRHILVDVAKSHEEVVGIPAPSALFMRFGDTGLEFELFCFVEDVERGARVKSDLHFAIFRAFAEAGVQMVSPAQPQPLDVSALEPLLRALLPVSGKGKLTSGVEVSNVVGPEIK